MTEREDLVDIRRLLLRYAALLDTGDLDGVAALFEAGTLQAFGGPVRRGATEVRATYDPVVLYDGLPRTRHLITNIDIDLDLDESGRSRAATSTSYFTVLHAPPGGEPTIVLAGTYADAFAREHGTHGAWHFASRVINAELQGDLRTHYQ